MRRDLLIARSRRTAFLRELALLAAQLVVLACIDRLVDPAALPAYSGTRADYMEFVSIGIVMSLVVGLLLVRVATALRGEQARGTLVALVTTPSAMGTVQLGSVAFDLFWVPLRMAFFLTAVAFVLGLDFDAAGVPAAAVLVLAVLPFAWGLGLLGAAAILVLRRGVASARLVVAVLGLASGAYFPLSLLPGSLESVERFNPMASALEGMRNALLGGRLGPAGVRTAAAAAAVGRLVVAGSVAFSLALAHERRHGAFAL